MANSDNVLRCGLTSKHIDVPELLRILRFEGDSVQPVPTRLKSRGETEYTSSAREFILSEIAVDADRDYQSCEQRSIELMICVAGQAVIEDTQASIRLPLDRGTSVVVPASVRGYRLQGEARIYKAAVPIGDLES